MSTKEKIEQLKSELKTLRAQAKEERKKQRRGYLERISDQIDHTFLRVADCMASKAKEIRYKHADPDGYESDQVVLSLEKLITRFEKRLNKGKALNEQHLKALLVADEALEVAVNKKLGHEHGKAAALRAQIRDIVPAEMAAADELDEQISEIMAKMKRSTTSKAEAEGVFDKLGQRVLAGQEPKPEPV